MKWYEYEPIQYCPEQDERAHEFFTCVSLFMAWVFDLFMFVSMVIYAFLEGGLLPIGYAGIIGFGIGFIYLSVKLRNQSRPL